MYYILDAEWLNKYLVLKGYDTKQLYIYSIKLTEDVGKGKGKNYDNSFKNVFQWNVQKSLLYNCRYL